MVKLTPNSIKRPAGASVRLEQSSTGLYVVRNAYEGRYEFFKNRPLRRQAVTPPSEKKDQAE